MRNMTQMHYEALAKLVQERAPLFRSEPARAFFAEDLAELLAEDNPRFDRVRFLQACGTHD